MIKTFLKHHIYEYCIHALFNGIQRNFIRYDGIKPGDHFNVIHVSCKPNRGFLVYHNVNIKNVEPYDGLYVVHYSYKRLWQYDKLKDHEQCDFNELVTIDGERYRLTILDPEDGINYSGDALMNEIIHYS